MKTPLLFAALLIGGLTTLNAQCTIGAACAPGPQGYCSVPSVNTSLPNGTTGVAYTTDIQLTLGTSVSIATITDATILSVAGLPTGFIYTTNPVNGVLAAGSSACLQVNGTTFTPGTYSIAVSFSINTSFGATTQPLTWYLTVGTTAGIQSLNQLSHVFLSPNPATSEITVASASQVGKIQIVDALGKTVITHDASYTTQTIINISSLSKGVYFMQVNDGSKISTKKFIKD